MASLSRPWASTSLRLELEKPIPLDDITGVLEADSEDEDMFLAGLGGKEQVFECIINGVCVAHPELILCIESEGNVVLFHMAYVKNGDKQKMVPFAVTTLNHIIRISLFPLLERCPDSSFSFLEDAYVPGTCSVYQKEYQFDAFVREAIKNSLYTAGTKAKDGADADLVAINKNAFASSKLRGMFLDTDDVNMLMGEFGVEKLRCGSDLSAMIRCTNKGHEDTNPSMSVKLTAMAWRLSNKIEVSDEMDRKLFELYRCDRNKRRDDDPFVFICDNAVQDMSSGRIYVLYTIKKYCFYCKNKG